MEEVVYVGEGDGIVLNLNGDWVEFKKDIPVQVNGLQCRNLLNTNRFRKVTGKEKLTYICKIKNRGRLYLMRGGGMGDVILLSPSLKKLKQTYPDLHITFATDANHHCLFQKNQYIDSLVPMHRSVEEYDRMNWSEWDVVLNINMYVEHSSLYPTTHRMDIFADAVGVKLEGRDRDLEISIDPIFEDLAERELIEMGWDPHRPLVTLQLRGMAPTRTFAPELNKKVSTLLTSKGFQVCLIDRDPIGWEGEGILNATGRVSQVGIVAGILKKAHVHLGPDSGVAHLAAAMGTRSAIFTTVVPSKLRYTYYKNFVVLEPTTTNFPCYEGHCPNCACIRSFSAEQMTEAVEYVYCKENDFECETYRAPFERSLKEVLDVRS
jgi:ADP-heptose:LPS heptosyltransferase